MAKKYKIQVIKLMMKDGKMHDFGSVHEAGAFNRPVEDLLKEKFIEEATKSDIEAFKSKDEAKEVSDFGDQKEEPENEETKTSDIKEELVDPLKVKQELAAKEVKK